jgi:hypothetical protein
MDYKFWKKKVDNSKIVNQTTPSTAATIIMIPKTEERTLTTEVSMKEQIAALERDALLRQAVHYNAGEIAERFTVQGSEYANTYKPAGKTALELINDFNERIDMDSFIRQTAEYLVGLDNVFIGIADINNPKIVPPSSISKIDEPSKVLVQTSEFGGTKIPLEELIHVRCFPRSGSPLGIGMIEPMLVTYESGPNILKTMNRMRLYATQAWERFANPSQILSLPGHPATEIEKLNNDRDKIPKSGELYFTNVENAKILSTTLDRANGYDKIGSDQFDIFLMATGNPFFRALMSPSLSPTTTQAIQELHRYQIDPLKREVKRTVEKIWALYLKHNGIDPDQAHVRLQWGQEKKVVLTLQDILAIRSAGGFKTDEEFRKNLKNLGIELDTEQTQVK